MLGIVLFGNVDILSHGKKEVGVLLNDGQGSIALKVVKDEAEALVAVVKHQSERAGRSLWSVGCEPGYFFGQVGGDSKVNIGLNCLKHW